VVALALLLTGAIACIGYGYNWGSDNMQTKWDNQKVRDKERIEKEAQEDRDAGYQLAQESITEKQELEKKYERLSTIYATSLQTSISCPTSGKLGDLMLPDDFIRSLFTHAESASAPRPATGRTNATVR
jgi:hypothetical protein